MTSTCPKDYYLTTFEQDQDSSAASTCPEHFKWIHEDLKPWKSTGITREMVERGENISQFRLVIIQGKAYLEKYEGSFQTRDLFTIWGILQLLRLYPGRIPDLELLFATGDVTVVQKQNFQGSQPMSPPPVFHYCGQKNAYDIVFPDWSFWGWAEVGIRPWEAVLQNIQESNKKIKWKDRVPSAFWKGNIRVSLNRYKLKKCNASDQHGSYAHIYSLHWDKEIDKGFQNTKLEDQCTHRYKIYVEGVAWSVSEKYILACDSMTLFIEPIYYDFFTRSLVPRQHYWPISNQSICEDVKYAVDWGNANPEKAEEIGKAGTRFIEENLKMKFVYDYMFHLLTEYARLLKFKPTIPEGAVEICSEILACPLDGLWRQYLVESMVNSPSDTPACTL
ncbi:O-glucosyltransferase rumi-like [Abrus precatorius]|uniref:O-glucosyltransferase rumi-like n=1 Tax=Abrus precatorius TaxID=3816 RepID=A0A8B8L2V8_ABRPR|nr:O-glucosyltransferase rumi-like [Abrus precatorius]